MSSERLGSNGEDRQGKTPPPKEGSDIFVQFPAPELRVYPPLDDIKRLFPAERFWITENVRIGLFLKACVQDGKFAKKDYMGEVTAFYQGAYAAVKLVRANKEQPPPWISKEAALDSLANMQLRRQFEGLSPQEGLLKHNERLSQKDDSDMHLAVLQLAFDRDYPKAFLSGATVIMDAYKTAEELREFKKTPRQKASQVLPLQIDNPGKTFKVFFNSSGNLLEEVKSMRRENGDLFRYVKKIFDDNSQTQTMRANGFLYGALAAYDLFRLSAKAQDKLPVRIPDEFVNLEWKGFTVSKRRGSERIFRDCQEELVLLTAKDKNFANLKTDFEAYKRRVPPDMFDGLVDGFSLVLRAFRSVAECDELERVPVDYRSESIRRVEREKKLRMKEEEIKRLEEWYGGGQAAA